MTIEKELSTLRAEAPKKLVEAVELGTGIAEGFSIIDSHLGPLTVTFNPAGVSSVDLGSDGFEERFRSRFGRRLVEAHPPRHWRGWIEKAIDRGRPGRLPIDFRSVTPFQRSVLEVAATIPRGEVRPYSWLARRVGRPRAARAVGTTMARNPVPLIIPCHRVVRADGSFGKYSLGGATVKRKILDAEGARLDQLEDLASRGVKFLGSDTTKIYCLPSCRHARRISDPHRAQFRSNRDAERSGYRPCEVCKP